MSTTKKQSASFEDKQARRGFIPAIDLAHAVGKHHSTIYRWIAGKKIESEQVGDFQWVKLSSVEKHLGEQAFKTYGLDKLLASLRRAA